MMGWVVHIVGEGLLFAGRVLGIIINRKKMNSFQNVWRVVLVANSKLYKKLIMYADNAPRTVKHLVLV